MVADHVTLVLGFAGRITERLRKGLVEMVSILVIFGVTLAILGLAATLFGVDSRDGDDWATHARL